MNLGCHVANAPRNDKSRSVLVFWIPSGEKGGVTSLKFKTLPTDDNGALLYAVFDVILAKAGMTRRVCYFLFHELALVGRTSHGISLDNIITDKLFQRHLRLGV